MSVNSIYGGYDGGAKQRAIKKALWDARFSDHVRARMSEEYLTSYNVSFTVGEDLRAIYVERARSYISRGLLESAMGFARWQPILTL